MSEEIRIPLDRQWICIKGGTGGYRIVLAGSSEIIKYKDRDERKRFYEANKVLYKDETYLVLAQNVTAIIDPITRKWRLGRPYPSDIELYNSHFGEKKFITEEYKEKIKKDYEDFKIANEKYYKALEAMMSYNTSTPAIDNKFEPLTRFDGPVFRNDKDVIMPFKIDTSKTGFNVIQKEIYNNLKGAGEMINLDIAKNYIGGQKSYWFIKRVIFNDPAVIVFWHDNTKTVVKAQEGDKFDPEKGFALAVLKKFFGNDNTFNKLINKFTVEETKTGPVEVSLKYNPKRKTYKPEVKKLGEPYKNKEEILTIDMDNLED